MTEVDIIPGDRINDRAYGMGVQDRIVFPFICRSFFVPVKNNDALYRGKVSVKNRIGDIRYLFFRGIVRGVWGNDNAESLPLFMAFPFSVPLRSPPHFLL